MLAIFNNTLVDPPQELNSPLSNPNPPDHIVKTFHASRPSAALSLGLGDSAFLSYFPPEASARSHRRIFCALDNVYCIFTGSLTNLSSLIRQYGLSAQTNEAMLVIQAYKTLRDRGPYPAHQVLRDLQGPFAFVLFDNHARTVFTALDGEEGGVRLYWGIAADGSTVICDDVEVMKKGGCGKSFAPFPAGCMFHSEAGLASFEHPRKKMKAMPRIDSNGAMCGAEFMVDVNLKIAAMPRVGSEANWALSGSR